MQSIEEAEKFGSPSESEVDTDALLFPETRLSRQRPNLWKPLAIFFASSTALLLAVLAWQHQEGVSQQNINGSFETGWITELPSSRNKIDVVGTKFTGNPSFYEDGTSFIPNPGNSTYTGDPSSEVDAAWQDLVGERDFLVTEEEAKIMWPSDYQSHWDNKHGGYWVGLDMFHALHCVATIYQYFNAEHYGIVMTDEKIMNHRDHCIDQLRQYVMCAGDLTVYGTRYYRSLDRNYADSDVTHMCRDFGKIRDWVRRRHSGDLAVLPNHKKAVDVTPADRKKSSYIDDE